MKVKEYLEQHKVEKITLIKARARKDANTPFYHQEYQTTPIFYKDELERMESLMDYIILNDKQTPIDWLSNVGWTNWFNRGDLKCMLIISEEDFALLYPSETQRQDLIKYIDNKIEE